MVEAVLHTNASTAAIWVMVVVIVAFLAFWLIAVTVASWSTKGPRKGPAVRTGVEAWGRVTVPRQAARPPSQPTQGQGSATPDLPAQRTGHADQPAHAETNADGPTGD
jgi:hypothetical protein